MVQWVLYETDMHVGKEEFLMQILSFEKDVVAQWIKFFRLFEKLVPNGLILPFSLHRYQGLGFKQLVLVLWWCRGERDAQLSINPSQLSRAWNARKLGIASRCIPTPRHTRFGFLISVQQRSYGRNLSHCAVSSLREDGESRSSMGREDGAVVAESNLVNAKSTWKSLWLTTGKVKRFLKVADLDMESFSRVYTSIELVCMVFFLFLNNSVCIYNEKFTYFLIPVGYEYLNVFLFSIPFGCK